MKKCYSCDSYWSVAVFGPECPDCKAGVHGQDPDTSEEFNRWVDDPDDDLEGPNDDEAFWGHSTGE